MERLSLQKHNDFLCYATNRCYRCYNRCTICWLCVGVKCFSDWKEPQEDGGSSLKCQSLCYPANLCVGLVEVRASDRVSQKNPPPQKSCLSACLVEAEESAAHIVVERESQVRFVGAVSAEAKFSSCSLSRSAGADEVTEALAGCCCSVSGGLSAHCKLRAHMPLTEHCVLSQYCIQRFYPPCIWQWSHLLPYVLLMSFNNRFSYSSESASSVM